ncbi:MAG: class II aldolase/adducin family protein [Bacteroidetes bacterium]|nr:class II aldolase/adducin family protein [Bacteroidota bacterium]
MHDEGYIKFNAEWTEGTSVSWHKIQTMNQWRQILFENGLIGALPDGIGYGNISTRDQPSKQFLITGSMTGNVKELGPEHFTRVTDYHFDENKLSCVGPIIASSESMTHAAFYEASRAINAVIHVHDADMWNTWIDRLPTTSPNVTYGTPEMAYEVIRLIRENKRPEKQLVIMGGHVDGVLAYGSSLGSAASTLLNCCNRLFRPKKCV